MSKNTNVLALMALVVVCIVWGTTYLVLRIGVAEFPAFMFAALRLLSAGAILIGFMWLSGKLEKPSWEVVLNQAIAGFFMFTMGNGLVSWAEIYVSSGLAAIISSMIPVWVILLNMFSNESERPNFPMVAGVLIGLSGIVLIFGQHLTDFSNAGYQWGIVAMFIANLGWALGSVWIKKKNQSSNIYMNSALQLIFGGLLMLPISALVDDYSKFIFTPTVVYALTYLSVVGSVLAYLCFSYAIKHLPVTIVSMYAYINPLVAVVLGAVVLDEKFTLRIFVAMLVTVAGVYMVNKGYQHRKTWRAELQRD